MKQYKYCLCQYNDEPDSLYIAELYVPKAYRHQGYGNKALEEAVQKAKEIGVCYLKLSVDRWSWKYKWYKRKGFTVFF